MKYTIAFGALALAVGGLFLLLLGTGTSWDAYLVWLIAWSVSGFVIYGLDKGLARASGPRVPELILSLLAAVGGFPGCWLGMAVFRHKSNARKHPIIWAVLVLSSAGHALWIYVRFLRS